MKKALVLSLSDPSTDPRPNRMINYLKKNNYIIDLFSFKLSNKIEVNKHYELIYKKNFFEKIKKLFLILIINFFYFLKINKFIFLFEMFYNNICFDYIKKMKVEKYDLFLVEDVNLLSLPFFINKNAKVIFDMREFYEGQEIDSIIFKIFIKKWRINILKKYLKDCSLLFTVSENIKKLYEEKYKVKVNLIRSLPYYHDIKVRKTDKENIKIIYFGAANRNRKIENLIYLSNIIDRRFSLYLILVGNEKYKSELKEKTKNNNRIIFKEPVEFKNLIYEINNYDMSFCYFEPTTKNLLYTLPNKFFESIMARVPLIIGPSPEMVPYLKEYSCGLYIDEFNIELLAKKINELTNEDIDKMKENCDKISKKLCWEEEEKVLDDLFLKYIGE